MWTPSGGRQYAYWNDAQGVQHVRRGRSDAIFLVVNFGIREGRVISRVVPVSLCCTV